MKSGVEFWEVGNMAFAFSANTKTGASGADEFSIVMKSTGMTKEDIV